MDFQPEGRPAHRPMLTCDFELCGFCVASRCTAARRLTIVTMAAEREPHFPSSGRLD